MPRSKTPKIPL